MKVSEGRSEIEEGKMRRRIKKKMAKMYRS